jgi:hypothetical protein
MLQSGPPGIEQIRSVISINKIYMVRFTYKASFETWTHWRRLAWLDNLVQGSIKRPPRAMQLFLNQRQFGDVQLRRSIEPRHFYGVWQTLPLTPCYRFQLPAFLPSRLTIRSPCDLREISGWDLASAALGASSLQREVIVMGLRSRRTCYRFLLLYIKRGDRLPNPGNIHPIFTCNLHSFASNTR